MLLIQIGVAKTGPLSVPTPSSTSSENDFPSNDSRSPLGPPRDHGLRWKQRTENISSPRTGPGAANFIADDDLARHRQALTLHDMLWDIFTGIMEPQLVVWTGIECCPFKRSFNVSVIYKTHHEFLLTDTVVTNHTHI